MILLQSINPARIFLWMGILYIVGLYLASIALGMLALDKKRFDTTIGGKQQVDASQQSLSIAAAAATPPLDTSPSTNSSPGVTVTEHRASDTNDALPISNLRYDRDDMVAVDVDGYNDQSAVSPSNQSTSDLPFTPCTMSWSDLSYSVKLKSGGTKDLLKQTTGYCKPGTMTALMGVSGAGKSTLLDVLCLRKTSGTTTGDILVNGAPINKQSFKKINGYCEQFDLHIPLYTVYESLLFSAMLRLPSTIPEERKKAFVEEIIEILDLQGCRDTLVGDSSTPGIASGERKLVSIGVELSANPSILCLDEPTSGLDATAALRVVTALRRLVSRKALTILCTIHQPSAPVFFMFDRLILLKRGGRVVYSDEIGHNGKKLVTYFTSLTSVQKPAALNPADWVLERVAINAEAVIETVKPSEGSTATLLEQSNKIQQPFDTNGKDHTALDSQAQAPVVPDFADVYNSSHQYEECKNQIESMRNGATHISSQQGHKESKYAAPYTTQFRHVFIRTWICYWRNVPFNGTRILIMTLLGLAYGLVFQNTYTTNVTSLENLLAVMNGIFMQVALAGIFACTIALPLIIGERPIFYREISCNTYNPAAYSASLFIVEIPWTCVVSVLYTCSFYYLVDMQRGTVGSVYFGYTLAIILISITFNSIGHLLAAALPDIMAASQVEGAVLSLAFLFGGLFVHGAQLPAGWLWIYNINPVPKAAFACLDPQYQFIDTPINVPSATLSGSLHSGLTTFEYVPTNQYISTYIFAMSNGSYWVQIGWMTLILVVIRIGVFLSFQFINHIKR